MRVNIRETSMCSDLKPLLLPAAPNFLPLRKGSTGGSAKHCLLPQQGGCSRGRGVGRACGNGASRTSELLQVGHLSRWPILFFGHLSNACRPCLTYGTREHIACVVEAAFMSCCDPLALTAEDSFWWSSSQCLPSHRHAG